MTGKKKVRPADDLDFGTPVVDSAYAELQQQGKLRRAVQMRVEARKLAAERDRLTAEILKCGDLAWVDKFVLRMLRQKKDVHKNLQRHFDELENRRRKAAIRARQIAQEVFELGLNVDIAPRPVEAKAEGVSIDSGDLGTGRNQNTSAQFRDYLIRRYRNLSNEELCKRLDFELGLVPGQPSTGLPESWTKKCGVNTYVDAYKNPRCQNLVQKLISKAKQVI